MSHPWFAAAAAPRVLAHRGLVTAAAARHGIAENSFAAFAEAHAAGAVYIESDCHLTRDGSVVLLHDASLTRVTGDPRAVADVDTRPLEELMAPHGGLITLEQALDAFPATFFNLDVKVRAAAEPVGRIAALHADRVLVTSFSDERRLLALAAGAKVSGGSRPATSAGTATIARVLTALASRSKRLTRRALAGIDALQIPERRGKVRVLSPRLIDAAHSAGVEVHVWTVNDPADMRRLLDQGVDGLVTDRADTALNELRKRSR